MQNTHKHSGGKFEMRIFIYRMDKGKFVKEVAEVDNIECLMVRTKFHDLPLKYINRASKFYYCLCFYFELSENQEKKVAKYWFNL